MYVGYSCVRKSIRSYFKMSVFIVLCLTLVGYNRKQSLDIEEKTTFAIGYVEIFEYINSNRSTFPFNVGKTHKLPRPWNTQTFKK